MMKLSQGERTVLKTGISKFKTFLLFILFAELISPQIPFKGFCKLNSFKVDSGYSNLLSLNYDLNEYSDLLVYNPFSKTAKLYDGKAGMDFSINKEITLPVELSKIEPIILDNGIIESYAFTSRKSRSFGILKFSISGKPSIKYQLKFDYYPENISISYNKVENYYDFLISGNSFNGLSVVSNKNKKLIEKKITDKTVFKDANFIDLNADGIDDIVALNSINNKIHLFFRVTNGDFEDLRQINIDENVLSLHVFDINYDSFKDIIISTTKSIIIFFGDSYAAYNNTVSIPTNNQADKFVYGDFNHDGYFDFSYLNAEQGIISTIFAKDFYTFYPEFIHRKEKGLIDIIPFFSKFVYGSAFLNQNGELNILSKVSSISDDQRLAVAIEPDLICSFDILNSGIIDLAYTDKYDMKIKFILRDAGGLPDKFYSIKLYDEANNLICFSNSKFVKTFFLFSSNNRLVQSIEVNFENFSFIRRHHYAMGVIEDLLVIPDAKNDPQLLILYAENKNLNLEVLTKYQSKYNSRYYKELTSKWFDPFFVRSENVDVGYWQAEQDKILLRFLSVKDNKYQTVTKLEIDKNAQKLLSKTNQDNLNSKLSYVSLISAKNNFYLINGENSVNIFTVSGRVNDLRITDKNQLFFGKNNSIFISDNNSNSLFEFIPNESRKQLAVKRIFSEIEINSYTIQKMEQRKSNIIFTNSKNSTIEIKQLPK